MTINEMDEFQRTDQSDDRWSAAEHQIFGRMMQWYLTGTGEMCERCGTSCADKTDLWRHVRAVHGDAIALNCPVLNCGRRFSSVIAAMDHVLDHHPAATGPRVYTCELCGQPAADHGALRGHVAREHPEARAAMCGVCGLYMGDVASLIDHVQAKHGAVVATEHAPIGGPYMRPKRIARCDVCGRRFGNRRLLRGHRSVHGHPGPVSPPYARAREMR